LSDFPPLRRLRELVADPGVRASAATRIIALVGAPVSLYLAATRLAPSAQGYYFVAVNVVALAQLFETGMGTIVVQFASHEWPRLRWGRDGGLEGEPAARDVVASLLLAGIRWYGTAALLLFAVAGVGGVLLYASSWVGSGLEFVVMWSGYVALTAIYLVVIPFVCVAEGCGDLVGVQHMRSWQAAATLVALWTGILAGGPLLAAWLGAAAQVTVAIAWLLTRHRALLRASHTLPAPLLDWAHGFPARYRAEQRRSSQLWLALYLAPQLLAPILLKLRGGDAAGRLGVTLAIALAPLTLAVAWLHGRYPTFGALVSEGRTAEFDALARRATRQAVAVFVAGAAALTLVVLALPFVLPAFAVRVLPLPSLLALFGGALASLLLQAMAGWLRAFRDEGIASPIVAGAVATVLVSGVAAALGGERWMPAAFAAASLGIAVPVAAVHFVRVRRKRMR
jgi:hypothetical protein